MDTNWAPTKSVQYDSVLNAPNLLANVLQANGCPLPSHATVHTCPGTETTLLHRRATGHANAMQSYAIIYTLGILQSVIDASAQGRQ